MPKQGINIELDKQDQKKLFAKISRIGEYSRTADIRLRNNSQDSANDAARRAPVKDANLRNSISARRVRKLVYETLVRAPYGAFVEWGTRHKFSKSNLKDMQDLGIPDSYAEQFKAGS